MYSKLKILFQIVLFIGSLGTLKGDDLLFDLGGVLVETNKVAAFREIGLTKLVKYVAEQRKIRGIGQHLRDRLFTFLETLEERKTSCPQAYDEKGRLLPQAMCSWLAGTTQPEVLLHMIEKKAKDHPELFVSVTEKNVLCSIARMMFNPERFTKTRAVNQQGLEFVRACRDAGHKTYILSNWEKESFELLKKNYPEFEELFDGYVISGQVKCIKPDTRIYNKLIEKYDLNPKNCIFFDDRQENLDAAAECGIATVLCTPEKVKTFDPLYDEINRLLSNRKSAFS